MVRRRTLAYPNYHLRPRRLTRFLQRFLPFYLTPLQQSECTAIALWQHRYGQLDRLLEYTLHGHLSYAPEIYVHHDFTWTDAECVWFVTHLLRLVCFYGNPTQFLFCCALDTAIIDASLPALRHWICTHTVQVRRLLQYVIILP